MNTFRLAEQMKVDEIRYEMTKIHEKEQVWMSHNMLLMMK